MKKFLYGIIAILAILVIAYVVVINLPQATTKNKEAQIKIEANELFSAFSLQEQKANKTYNGKVIEVTGEVRKVTKDKKGSTVVILKTDDMIGGILCTFENQPSKELKKGQKVTIKGQCSGLLMDVVLNKCNLIK